MQVFECICIVCGSRYACKWVDEEGTVHKKLCRECLFSKFDRNCLADVDAIVEISHGYCRKCFDKRRRT